MVLGTWSLCSFKADGENMSSLKLFSSMVLSTRVLFSLSPFVMDEVILVRWEKMAENVPEEKIHNIPIKRGKRLQSHSYFAAKGRLRYLPLFCLGRTSAS